MGFLNEANRLKAAIKDSHQRFTYQIDFTRQTILGIISIAFDRNFARIDVLREELKSKLAYREASTANTRCMIQKEEARRKSLLEKTLKKHEFFMSEVSKGRNINKLKAKKLEETRKEIEKIESRILLTQEGLEAAHRTSIQELGRLRSRKEKLGEEVHLLNERETNFTEVSHTLKGKLEVSQKNLNHLEDEWVQCQANYQRQSHDLAQRQAVLIERATEENRNLAREREANKIFAQNALTEAEVKNRARKEELLTSISTATVDVDHLSRQIQNYADDPQKWAQEEQLFEHQHLRTIGDIADAKATLDAIVLEKAARSADATRKYQDLNKIYSQALDLNRVKQAELESDNQLLLQDIEYTHQSISEKSDILLQLEEELAAADNRRLQSHTLYSEELAQHKTDIDEDIRYLRQQDSHLKSEVNRHRGLIRLLDDEHAAKTKEFNEWREDHQKELADRTLKKEKTLEELRIRVRNQQDVLARETGKLDELKREEEKLSGPAES